MRRLQFNFLPSVSKKSTKSFRDKIKTMRIHSFTGRKIEIIAEMINPIIRGWYSIDCVNRRLVKWAICKFKRFKGYKKRAKDWFNELAKREPRMFAHWALEMFP